MRQITGIYGPGSNHWVGDGFPVRNLFPSNGVDLNPFLMLDYAGPEYFPPSEKPRGVGEHPHRGFETVTIVYQGRVSHRDSSGSAGVIGPGDVQWMTAASGVVHEEMHEREFARAGGMFEVIQLWVNLPRAHKMSKPKYQTVLDAQIPVVNGARVIAGSFAGVAGPATTFTPITIVDLKLKGGERTVISMPAGDRTALVLLSGVLTIGDREMRSEATMALFEDAAGEIAVEAREDSRALLLSGTPIPEPVVSYGPFVMNTEDEIRQAVLDYRAGRMGRLNQA